MGHLNLLYFAKITIVKSEDLLTQTIDFVVNGLNISETPTVEV